MAYTNSGLVSYKKLSPNHSGQRTMPIDRITPHCVVGQSSVETLGAIFANKARRASCQYGIGSDGRIGMYVEEKNRSWCSSSAANDQRSVTIECASDTAAPYAFRTEVFESLVHLCADICRRNGKTKLLWLESKTKTLSYTPAPNEMVLTVHRWFANKSCPGDWLMERMWLLADRVNRLLKEEREMSNFEIRCLIDETVAAAKAEIMEEVNARLPGPKPVYDALEDIPDWGRSAVERRVRAGILKGDENGRLGLTQEMIRMWVIDDREDGLA